MEITRSGGDPLGDAPRAVPVAGLDVLAGDQGQQADRVGLLGVELDVLDGVDDRQRVVDQPGDQRRLGVGVVPGAHRLARRVVVMSRHLHRGGFGDQSPDPADRRDQLGHGVLGGDRVIEQRRVQRPAASCPPTPRSRRSPRGPRRRSARGARLTQPGPPIGEHRVVDALVIERQTRRHLPADVVRNAAGRVTIRQALQGLQHHHRGDHIAGHRRPTPPRREQVREQLVGEQLAGGDRPGTRAPNRPAPAGGTTPPRPTTPGRDRYDPAPTMFSIPAKNASTTAGLFNSLLGRLSADG